MPKKHRNTTRFEQSSSNQSALRLWMNYLAVKMRGLTSAARAVLSPAGKALARVPRKTRTSLAALAAIACAVGFTWHAMNTPDWSGEDAPRIVRIAPGTAARFVPETLDRYGIRLNRILWRSALFLTRSHDIHAGFYRFTPDDSLIDILLTLRDKKAHLFTFRIAEGATYWETLEAMEGAEGLVLDLNDKTPAEILKAIGAREKHLEGLFFPDTYSFHAGVAQSVILRQAYLKQQSVLAELWKGRDPQAAPKTPYEALILGSIIEREVGIKSDRYVVSGIFTNRLRIGMALQTDPTLIYGQGRAYGGKITRQVIEHRNVYNTYRLAGLPPTPIGMVSKESLHAALHPAKTPYFYFINKDNGELVASRTLEEHNEAVNRYIRKSIP